MEFPSYQLNRIVNGRKASEQEQFLQQWGQQQQQYNNLFNPTEQSSAAALHGLSMGTGLTTMMPFMENVMDHEFARVDGEARGSVLRAEQILASSDFCVACKKGERKDLKARDFANGRIVCNSCRLVFRRLVDKQKAKKSMTSDECKKWSLFTAELKFDAKKIGNRKSILHQQPFKQSQPDKTCQSADERSQEAIEKENLEAHQQSDPYTEEENQEQGEEQMKMDNNAIEEKCSADESIDDQEEVSAIVKRNLGKIGICVHFEVSPADLDSDFIQWSQIMATTLLGHEQVVHFLLCMGADVFHNGKWATESKEMPPTVTALHLAALRGHAEVMAMILHHIIKKHGMNVCRLFINAQDSDGNTAFHYASWARHETVIQVLEIVANPNIRNKFGHLPFDLLSSSQDCQDVRSARLTLAAFFSASDVLGKAEMSIASTEKQESNKQPFSNVQIVTEQGRHNLQLYFIVITPSRRLMFCQRWKHTYVEIAADLFAAPFRFGTNSYGPGRCKTIESDGNCAFRALSFPLTGTEENHLGIRAQVAAYLAESAEKMEDWLMLFNDKENQQGLLEHIEKLQKSGSWADNLDLLAAAKCFNINIVVAEKIGNGQCRWQLYTPGLTNSLLAVEQDMNISSVFLHFVGGNHFEVILKPQCL